LTLISAKVWRTFIRPQRDVGELGRGDAHAREMVKMRQTCTTTGSK
jgi:hypothetical protein